jgi:hypothetical protein
MVPESELLIAEETLSVESPHASESPPISNASVDLATSLNTIPRTYVVVDIGSYGAGA